MHRILYKLEYFFRLTKVWILFNTSTINFLIKVQVYHFDYFTNKVTPRLFKILYSIIDLVISLSLFLDLKKAFHNQLDLDFSNMSMKFSSKNRLFFYS